MPRPSDYGVPGAPRASDTTALGESEQSTPARGFVEKRDTPPSAAVSSPGSPCSPDAAAREDSPDSRARLDLPKVSGMCWPEEDNPTTPSPLRLLSPVRGSMSSEQQSRLEERHAVATARFLSRSRAARQQRSPIVHPNAPLATSATAAVLDDESTTATVTSPKDAARQSRDLLVIQVVGLKQAKRDLRAALDEETQKLRDEQEHVEELEEELARIRGTLRARESQYAGTTWAMAEEMTSLRAQLATANDRAQLATADDERVGSRSTLEFEKAELGAKNRELEIQNQRWKLHATRATFRGVIKLDAALLSGAWDAWVEWSSFRREQQLLMKTTQRELQSGKARIEALEREVLSLRTQLQEQERRFEKQHQRHQQSETIRAELHRTRLERQGAHIIKRWQTRTVRKAFVSWYTHVNYNRWTDAITVRIISRMQSSAAASAMDAWRCCTVECAQQRRLVSKILSRNARRELTNVLLAWYTSTMSRGRHRAVVAHAAARICRSTLLAALEAWWSHATSTRSIRLLGARLLARMQHVCVASAFDVWMHGTKNAVRYRTVLGTHLRQWKMGGLAQTFAGWKSRMITRRQHASVAARCTAVIAQGQVARVWRHWSRQAKQSVKSRFLMQRFVRIMRNSMLMSVWQRWYNGVSERVLGKALNLRADRMVTGKNMRTAALILRNWCTHAAFVRRSVALTKRALARMKNDVLLSTVESWANWAAERSRIRAVLKKASLRKLQAAVAGIFSSWRQWTTQRRNLQKRLARSIGQIAITHTRRVWTAWASVAEQRMRKKTKQQHVQAVLARSRLSSVWHKWHGARQVRARRQRLLARAKSRIQSRMVATAFILWSDFTAQSLDQMLQHDEMQLKEQKIRTLQKQVASSEAACADTLKQLVEHAAAEDQELVGVKKMLRAAEERVASEQTICTELRNQLSEQAAATEKETAIVRKQLAAARLQIQSSPRNGEELRNAKDELQTVRKDLLLTQNEYERVQMMYDSEVVAAVASCTDGLVAQVMSAPLRTIAQTATERLHAIASTQNSAEQSSSQNTAQQALWHDSPPTITSLPHEHVRSPSQSKPGRGSPLSDFCNTEHEVCADADMRSKASATTRNAAGPVELQSVDTGTSKNSPHHIVCAEEQLQAPWIEMQIEPQVDASLNSLTELANIRAQLVSKREQVAEVASLFERCWEKDTPAACEAIPCIANTHGLWQHRHPLPRANLSAPERKSTREKAHLGGPTQSPPWNHPRTSQASTTVTSALHMLPQGIPTPNDRLPLTHADALK